MTLFWAAAIVVVDALLLWLVLSGAPFVPSKKSAVEKFIFLAEIKPGDKAADLGSGDGRIVIAMAKAGAEAHGFEINPGLVWWSRRKILQAGLGDKAFIHQANLWKVNLSRFDVVTLFGVSHIMRRLEKKLEIELKPGSRIISLAFKFPHWQISGRKEEVFLYRR